MSIDFPVEDLMDQVKCYNALLRWLHPGGLACPRCEAREGLNVHRRDRDPVIDYRCKACGRVFNAFTGTVFDGTHRRPAELVLIVREFAQGVSTAQLAREHGASRWHLLELRHRLQANAEAALDRSAPLGDAVVEADEMYQNAGEKRRKARRPGRPAAAAGQRRQGARHVGQRPPAGAGRRRARVR
jgi:transposase-like protein